MKFKTILTAFIFAVIFGGYSNVYGSIETVSSILDGEDTEAKVENAMTRFLGSTLNSDISEFESLTGRGENHLESFENACNLFVGLATAINAMHEAFTLMYQDFPNNQAAKTNIKLVALMTSDAIDDEDFVDFNRGMGWATLRIKFKLVGGYEILYAALPSAYDKHIELKTRSLQRQYGATAKKLPPLQESYAKIDELYPDMPDPIDVHENVKILDLKTLKGILPEFKEDVEVYKTGLLGAKKWQVTFTIHHKKQARYLKEFGTIEEKIADLREKNEENPEIPEGDLEGLESLDDIGDLEEIEEVLKINEARLKELRSLLSQAREWEPELLEPVIEENADVRDDE